MASFSSVLPEGASINRPPAFNGTGYTYWKTRMKIFIEAIDLDIWDAIENGCFVPTYSVDGRIENKPRDKWSDEDKKKVQFDAKAKNIITSALGYDEYFRVSNCKTAQEMWDTLQVTHEGTSEVKRSRVNTLTQEYELFRMNSGESIQDMQKRFTHIINHLGSLGKSFSNEDLINKVLRCLNREWQPKVTAIAESRNLATMTLPTLFGKLQEHEMELNRLIQQEDGEKKKKSLALKASTSKREEDDESDVDFDEETLNFLVRRFGKVIKKKDNDRRSSFPSKKNNNKGEAQNSPTCFECGKLGHMRMECPQLQKKDKLSKRQGKERKGRKAYIAWEDNDMDSTDESEDEEANLCLMAKEEIEVCNSNLECQLSYTELQDTFDELYCEFQKVVKSVSFYKKNICDLEKHNSILRTEIEELKQEKNTLGQEKVNSSINNKEVSTKTQNIEETSCSECPKLIKEIEDLKTTVAKFTLGRDNLNILLGKQRCVFNKAGLGYQPKMKQKYYKNFFVPPKKSSSPFTTCFYCNRRGHSASTCYIRNKSMVDKMWVPKEYLMNTNVKGPKKIWVPKAKI